MNFLICDENKDDALYLKDLLKYEFLFLNIKLKNKNGIELGIQIKEEFPNLHIILTSAFKEYLEDGYKTKADRFFIKPIHPHLFKTEMKNLLLSYNQEEPVFYDSKVSNVRIPYKNIMYIEYMDRYTYIDLNNHKILKTKYKMYEWLELLKNLYFAQSYKSILINLNYVDEIKKKDVVLEDGFLLPLSKHFHKSFEQKWVDFIRNALVCRKPFLNLSDLAFQSLCDFIQIQSHFI